MWAGPRSCTVAVLAATVALSGCTGAPTPTLSLSPTSTVTPDTSGVDGDLLAYYGQLLEWTDCGEGLDCTTVTAPLDWDDPGRDGIQLAVVRHRATDGDARGSIVLNPGGPGISGFDVVHDAYGRVFGLTLIEQFDLIGFDPRGVGRSAPVTCAADALDAYLFAAPDAPRGSAGRNADLTAVNEEFLDACEAGSDGVLPYISTVEAARDLDLLRAVLGRTTLDYLGYSYGTKLGATYAELYPDRVGRFVLDAALDPGLSSVDLGTSGYVALEAGLRTYLADCVTRDGCPFSGSVDDAVLQLRELLAHLDDTPVDGSDGRPLGAAGLLLAIRASLYAPDQWRTLSRAITEAGEGRGGSALAIVDDLFGRVGGQYPTNEFEAATAYRCRDYVLPSRDEAEAFAAAVAAVAPTFAPYLDVTAPDVCAIWPGGPADGPLPVVARGAAPIVVIGTTGDPITPYDGAVSLAERLDSGVLVTFEGAQHTAYPTAGRCIGDAVESFFVDGTVPPDGLVCE